MRANIIKDIFAKKNIMDMTLWNNANMNLKMCNLLFKKMVCNAIFWWLQVWMMCEVSVLWGHVWMGSILQASFYQRCNKDLSFITLWYLLHQVFIVRFIFCTLYGVLECHERRFYMKFIIDIIIKTWKITSNNSSLVLLSNHTETKTSWKTS